MRSFKRYSIILLLIVSVLLSVSACSKSEIKPNIGLMNATKESYSLWIGNKKEPKAENKIEASGLKFFPTTLNGTKDKKNGTIHITDRIQLNASKDGQLVSVQFIETDKILNSNDTFIINWDGKSFSAQGK